MNGKSNMSALLAALIIGVPGLATAGTVPGAVDNCVKEFLQTLHTKSGAPPALRALLYEGGASYLEQGELVTLTARDPEGTRVVARATCVVGRLGGVQELRAEPTTAVH